MIASIALVRSIKRYISIPVDFVCFTTFDNTDIETLLLKEFDFVVRVEPIRFAVNMKMPTVELQQQYDWLDMCFTKINVFRLTCYEKVLFLDSDMMCFGDIGGLFSLPTPAGCLIPQKKGKCQSGYQTGALLPIDVTLKAMVDGYGISAACFLIAPNETDFESMMHHLNERVYKNHIFYEDMESVSSMLSEQEQPQI